MLAKTANLVAVIGGAVAVASAIGAGTVWALDQRYWNVSDQKQFEVRQLRRDVKRAELVCKQTQQEADCIYYEYLREDLESLQ